MKITNEFLTKGRSPRGGWSKKQFQLIGISWPPKKGWKRKIIGTHIPENDAMEFLDCAAKKMANHHVDPVQFHHDDPNSPESIATAQYLEYRKKMETQKGARIESVNGQQIYRA